MRLVLYYIREKNLTSIKKMKSIVTRFFFFIIIDFLKIKNCKKKSSLW